MKCKNKDSSSFVDSVLDSGSLQEAISYFPPEVLRDAESLLRHLINSGDAWDRLGELRGRVRSEAYANAYRSGAVVY